MNISSLDAIPAIQVKQPIGTFYLASIPAVELVKIAWADLRHMETELDKYVGIQRELKKERVLEIGKFVNSLDATFPTSVVLAVKGVCATYDEKTSTLTLHEGIDEVTGERIPLNEIAKILDGQHRVEGLKALAQSVDFDVPLSIFVDADISDQAYIFATVNLAQTKVNKSLVYDLLDYSKARSPQRSAHDIVVALDAVETSPFYQRIKRLGTATPGRPPGTETLAQATVVNSILPLITRDPETDRFDLAKGKRMPEKNIHYESTPLRHLWIRERDTDIAKILFEYFSSVKEKWPAAWASRENGAILARTNGFRAFTKFFKLAYLKERPALDYDDPVVKRDDYKKYFSKVKLIDSEFNSSNFLPGSGGETKLYNELRQQTGI